MSKECSVELVPLGDGPVSKIRVSVVVDDTTDFFHPAHFAAAARYFAEDQENTANKFSEVFGPYQEIRIGL